MWSVGKFLPAIWKTILWEDIKYITIWFDTQKVRVREFEPVLVAHALIRCPLKKANWIFLFNVGNGMYYPQKHTWRSNCCKRPLAISSFTKFDGNYLQFLGCRGPILYKNTPCSGISTCHVVVPHRSFDIQLLLSNFSEVFTLHSFQLFIRTLDQPLEHKTQTHHGCSAEFVMPSAKKQKAEKRNIAIPTWCLIQKIRM